MMVAGEPPQSRCRPSFVPETAVSPAAGEGATGPGAARDFGVVNRHLQLIYLGGRVGRTVVAGLPGWFVYEGYYGAAVWKLSRLIHSYRCEAHSDPSLLMIALLNAD
jgi:hypothetical protein